MLPLAEQGIGWCVMDVEAVAGEEGPTLGC
jgi:hypothetical protein